MPVCVQATPQSGDSWSAGWMFALGERCELQRLCRSGLLQCLIGRHVDMVKLAQFGVTNYLWRDAVWTSLHMICRLNPRLTAVVCGSVQLTAMQLCCIFSSKSPVPLAYAMRCVAVFRRWVITLVSGGCSWCHSWPPLHSIYCILFIRPS